MTRTSTLLTLTALIWAAPSCASAPGATTAVPATTVGDPSGAPRTFQPGAPGEGAREVDSGELQTISGARHTEADVRFMRGMIHHHAQALEMVALMEGRTPDRTMRQLGLRIEISQRDEIGLMSAWLRRRGEEAPAVGAQGAMHHMMMMPGMLTPEQMEQLRAATGVAFERLFLELMIQHHTGALTMVQELFSAPGGGQESDVFRFATDVEADQTMEITRMQSMLDARR